MQLQPGLRAGWSCSPGSEIPAVNEVEALGQKQGWEVGDERKGNWNALHLTQKVKAPALTPPQLCLHAAALISEGKSLK